MKIKALLTLCGLTAIPVYAQLGGDPNTPPAGAPTAIYKTLDQVEPRTPLVDGAPGVTVGGTGTVTIDQSGSYFLNGSVEVTSGDGVRILADEVTLDLGGFSVGTAAGLSGGDGISIQASNVSIRNGHITGSVKYTSGSGFSGTGFTNGVRAVGAERFNIRINDVSVMGCLEDGIDLSGAEGTIAENCIVTNVEENGIQAEIVKSSVASVCGIDGIIGSVVSNCVGRSIGTGNVFDAGVQGQVVEASVGVGEAATGVLIPDGLAIGSHGTSQSQEGVAGSLVLGSFGETDQGDGVSATSGLGLLGRSDNGNGISGIIIQNAFAFGQGTGNAGIDGEVVTAAKGINAGGGANGVEAIIGVSTISSGPEVITNKYLAP